MQNSWSAGLSKVSGAGRALGWRWCVRCKKQSVAAPQCFHVVKMYPAPPMRHLKCETTEN